MSKYNAKKTEVDGIKFDSQAEAQYYEHLKERKRRGEIQAVILQPVYVLQDAFRKNGQLFRKIEYKADFEIVYPDGSVEVIDVKGFETPDFKIKRKLFEKKYEHPLKLVKYVKKYGGWITVDEWKKRKREEKKGVRG